MTKKIKKPQTLVQWGHEEVTLLELFKKLDKFVSDPVRNLHDMDGDMYISDYRKLSEAQWRIHVSLEKYKNG